MRRIGAWLSAIVTPHFWRTCVAMLVACLFAYLPFIVIYIEMLLKPGTDRWQAFGDSLEHALVSSIAVCLAGILTWWEYEKETNLGRVADIFALMSLFGVFGSLLGFFITHYAKESISSLIARGGGIAQGALWCLCSASGFAFLTVLEVRRARDRAIRGTIHV